MDWVISNNVFQRHCFLQNPWINLLADKLKKYDLYSFYLRGSLIEGKPLHPKADIDLYLIYPQSFISRHEVLSVLECLDSFNRYVDLHLICYNRLNHDIPNRLLLHARSIHVTGAELHFNPVEFNNEMIAQHWLAYDPSFAPDVMYSTVRSRVCALKNLTRCFGLINLMENTIFSRDIQECMEFAKKMDEHVHDMLFYNWSIVDLQIPLELREIKEYLLAYKQKKLSIESFHEKK